MNHTDVRRCMADYLEGDLALDKRALLDAHLDECDACSSEIAQMRATISLLRSLPEPVVPAGLGDAVMRRIRAGESRPGLLDRLQEAVQFVLAPRLLVPLSAAAVGAGIALWSGQLEMAALRESGAGARPLQITLAAPSPDRLALATGDHSTAEPFAAVSRPLGASASGAESARPESMPIEAAQDIWVVSSRSLERDLIASLMAPQLAPGARRAISEPSQIFGQPPQTLPAASNRLLPSLADSRSLPSSQEWLLRIEQNPARFADQLAGLSLAEQELWVDRLARSALEAGSFELIVAALRASPSRQARLLADEFAAVAGSARVESAAAPGDRTDP